MDKQRRIRPGIQALTTIVTNLNMQNFFEGTINQGAIKQICVPGLNCYSCPGAIASCPIGAFQSVAGTQKFNFSYYILGICILFGTVLGRVVCGFLCPFGWFQELLHKIPSRKISSKKVRWMTKLKYAVLVLFVCILPIVAVNAVGLGNPTFCKYICPVGILEGGIPLAMANPAIRNSLGWLFTWKSIVLMGLIILGIFFYRPFCKWICPLGAFYGLFNKVALYRYSLKTTECTDCGLCATICKMDIDIRKQANDSECIRCGECMHQCPKQAIQPSIHIKIKNREVGKKHEK
ncbi:MAG: 4Fe-4S binding protein [Cellulosilyticaceae bacterium]